MEAYLNRHKANSKWEIRMESALITTIPLLTRLYQRKTVEETLLMMKPWDMLQKRGSQFCKANKRLERAAKSYWRMKGAFWTWQDQWHQRCLKKDRLIIISLQAITVQSARPTNHLTQTPYMKIPQMQALTTTKLKDCISKNPWTDFKLDKD
jgi:hypothetical protein